MILIDKFNYYQAILEIDMGKDIKFVDLSYVEWKYVMNCYVFI